jgi:hypothetical protein
MDQFDPRRIFLLSPANLTGKRAKMLLDTKARFDLARRLQNGDRVPLAELFAFISGLYFRGKLAYARAFGSALEGNSGPLIITSSHGLVAADAWVSAEELRAYYEVPIDAEDERYSRPLIRDAAALASRCSSECSVVLLGSVASGKYVDHLLPIFGEKLHFPQEFVGRGDMSRGGLMLRSVAANRMLTHVPLAGALRRGCRPPKLEPVKIPNKSSMSQHNDSFDFRQ